MAAFITNPLSKRSINPTGRVARKVYSLCKAGNLVCSVEDMAILEKHFGPKNPKIVADSPDIPDIPDIPGIPELPLHIIDKIVCLASKGSCRDYNKNKLISKEINTTPYEFEFADNGDVDDFFDYAVHTHFPACTLGQLKNPKNEKEIAFSKQFVTFYDTLFKKNVEFLKTRVEKNSAANRAKWATLWVYKVIICKLVSDSIDVFYDDWNISTLFSDSDSLYSVKKKLGSYITANTLHIYTYTHIERDNLSITSDERYNLSIYK